MSPTARFEVRCASLRPESLQRRSPAISACPEPPSIEGLGVSLNNVLRRSGRDSERSQNAAIYQPTPHRGGQFSRLTPSPLDLLANNRFRRSVAARWRTSATIRTARSQSSRGYVLGRAMRPIVPKSQVSERAGRIHLDCSCALRVIGAAGIPAPDLGDARARNTPGTPQNHSCCPPI